MGAGSVPRKLERRKVTIMVTKNARLSIYAIATAAALSAMTAASVPAFAWGSSAPDNYYSQAAQGSDYYSGYYNYAPGAVVAHKKGHTAR